jgi:hypothetical protein
MNPFLTGLLRGGMGAGGAFLKPTAPGVVVVKSKNKPTPSIEVVGVKTPALKHSTASGTQITQTTFDTSTRPDQARILFTNASGVTQYLTACWIQGKVVKKVGGDSGFLNDKHVNYEAIARDGEQQFELGNDFICTLTQVNKLADYHWKWNKTKKHIYTISLSGFQSFFEPGEWYVLTIGAAGTAEYIDSTVECYSVRCSMSATGSMGTQVSFREVEENWKFDSNEVARYIAAGGHTRNPQENVVTVAASGYPGYADYYCPGTSDDAGMINQALVDGIGRAVRLTAGDYHIYSDLLPQSNTLLYGEGTGTNLRTSGMDNTTGIAINLIGQSTAPLEHIRISSLQMSEPAGSSCYMFLRGEYANDISIEDSLIVTSKACPAYMTFCHRLSIMGNEITSASTGSTELNLPQNLVVIGASDGLIANNKIHDVAMAGGGAAIFCASSTGGLDNTNINNNIISNIRNNTTQNNYVCGIYVSADRVTISSNRISGVKAASSTAMGIYITSGATNTMVANNLCINNGSDTGIANTNQHNFYDAGVDTQVG